MNNFFLATAPYTRVVKPSLFFKIIRKALRVLKIGELDAMILNPMVDMTTVEQRISYFHLLTRVIDQKIPGEVVELGTFTGYCAMLFQKVLEQNNSEKLLHVYDSFEIQFAEKGSVLDKLKANFKLANLKLPVLHKGYFEHTLPNELPENIALAHLDCGFGGNELEHKKNLLFCLNQVYPKLSKGAICILMDYMDGDGIAGGYDVNSGTKLAINEFLQDKPERMMGLYGNQCYHGYFVKQ